MQNDLTIQNDLFIKEVMLVSRNPDMDAVGNVGQASYMKAIMVLPGVDPELSLPSGDSKSRGIWRS